MIDARTLDLSPTHLIPGQDYFVALNNIDRRLAIVAPDLFAANTYYIEAGANDGIKQSNTFYLEKICGAKGLLVEPALNLYENLIKNRSQDNSFRCGALVSRSFSSELVKLIYCDLMTLPLGTGEGPEKGYEYKHFKDGSSALPDAMKIPIIFGAQPLCLSDVLLEVGAPKMIDLLCLDVEGSELGVLQGIDFSLHSFRYILIETWNITEVANALEAYGYESTHQITDNDFLFQRKSTGHGGASSLPKPNQVQDLLSQVPEIAPQQIVTSGEAQIKHGSSVCFVNRLVSTLSEDPELAEPKSDGSLRSMYYHKLGSVGRPPIDNELINSSYFSSIQIPAKLKYALLRESLSSSAKSGQGLEVNIYGLYHDMNPVRRRRVILDSLFAKLSPSIAISEIKTINPLSFDDLPRNENSLNIIFTNQYALFVEEAVAALINYLQGNPASLLVTYFTDSHHMLNHTAYFAAISDFLFLGHPSNVSLATCINPHVHLLRNSLTQWDPLDAVAQLHEESNEPRRQELFGWHNEYPQFPRRNNFLNSLHSSGFPEARLLAPEEYQKFAKFTPIDKLKHWLQYDHSLVVPTLYDLPIRLFDALSSGQNVLVPFGCTHLDRIIPSAQQLDLGIFRYVDESIESVQVAYNKALSKIPSNYERLERSLYVANNHSIARIAEESIAQVAWRIAHELDELGSLC